MSKLLLVEDEQMISEPLAIVLRFELFDVDVARNGLEALVLCKKTRYDLILLDLMMPVCNGVEFLRKAKLTSTSPHTKVIVLSNLSGNTEIDEALALGADKSVLKASITPRSLTQMVRDELGEPGSV